MKSDGVGVGGSGGGGGGRRRTAAGGRRRAAAAMDAELSVWAGSTGAIDVVT